MDINNKRPYSLYANCSTVDTDSWIEYLSTMDCSMDSPKVAMRLLLKRTIYKGLPLEIQEMIVQKATQDKLNAIHCALAHMHKTTGASEPLVFRENIQQCVTMIRGLAHHIRFRTVSFENVARPSQRSSWTRLQTRTLHRTTQAKGTIVLCVNSMTSSGSQSVSHQTPIRKPRRLRCRG